LEVKTGVATHLGEIEKKEGKSKTKKKEEIGNRHALEGEKTTRKMPVRDEMPTQKEKSSFIGQLENLRQRKRERQVSLWEKKGQRRKNVTRYRLLNTSHGKPLSQFKGSLLILPQVHQGD